MNTHTHVHTHEHTHTHTQDSITPTVAMSGSKCHNILHLDLIHVLHTHTHTQTERKKERERERERAREISIHERGRGRVLCVFFYALLTVTRFSYIRPFLVNPDRLDRCADVDVARSLRWRPNVSAQFISNRRLARPAGLEAGNSPGLRPASTCAGTFAPPPETPFVPAHSIRSNVHAEVITMTVQHVVLGLQAMQESIAGQNKHCLINNEDAHTLFSEIFGAQYFRCECKRPG